MSCYKAQRLTLRRYGIDSKYIDVADILFVSVIKPCVKLQNQTSADEQNV